MITSIWAGPGGDISTAKALRKAVFEDELGLKNTWDMSDDYAFHLVLMLDDVPVAAGRITYGGVGVAKLGRICVAKKYRRQGIGDGLVKILDYKASELGMGYSQVDVAAEVLPFYHRLGYQPCGEPFFQWDRQLTPMKKETNDGTRENCTHQCPGKKSQD